MIEGTVCNKAIAYLKPIIHDNDQSLLNDEVLELSHEESIAELPFNDDLIINFVYEVEDFEYFLYVNNGNLEEENMTIPEQRHYGIDNLIERANEYNLQIQEYETGCYGLILDGNFEASLILIDNLWEDSLKHYITNNFIVAIPSRDVLVFCDSQSEQAIEELKRTIQSVWEDGDHLLTNKLLIRSGGKWEYR
ncbi:DUF1444 domain-containing protein [Paenibacillus sp. GCM10023250]|uniref:DUF1444 domain-containing protein n=1 Tax=Paenibacillus sp. GCM10023250 TaxID=3252648 RepID=UPI00361ABDB0